MLNDPTITRAAFRRDDYIFAGLVRTFARVDTILAGRAVKTMAVDNPVNSSPAWSSSNMVYFNRSRINPGMVEIEDVIRIQGLNYHELSHILFTPRSPFENAPQYHSIWNLLEDQRIETMLTQRFPSTVKYLTATVLYWVVGGGGPLKAPHMDEVLPLVRGRRYLPREVREAALLAYSNQGIVPELCAIIDEYRTLSYPSQLDRGKELVVQLYNLLPTPPKTGCSTCSGGGNKEEENTADPSDGESQESDDESESGKGEGDEEEGNERGAGDSGESEDESEGKGSGDSDDESEGDDEGKSGSGKSENDKGKPANSDPKRSPGAGTDEGKALRDAIKNAINEVNHDPEVIKEAQNRREQAKRGATHYEEALPVRRTSATIELTAEARAASRRFEDELRKLAHEAEAGWDRRTSAGRLNIDRYIGGCDTTEAFDRWDEGTDGYDLDVVTLLDLSDSMNGTYAQYPCVGFNATNVLAESAWVIDRAVKEIGGTSRTYTFDVTTKLVYGETEKSPDRPKRFDPYGGTRPLDALRRAEDTLSASKRLNKLLIIVTDGEWQDTEESETVLARIAGRGATVAVAYVNTCGYKLSDQQMFVKYGHGAHIFQAVRTPGDLVKWCKAVVTQVVKRRGGR